MTTLSSPSCACSVQGDEPVDVAVSSSAQAQGNIRPRRRRHSFFLPRRKSIIGHIIDTEEGLLLKVDLFLSELERRLDFIENHGDPLDSSISRAFSTLQAVRERCCQASEEVLGEGRRRLHVMVETLEARYHEGLTSGESLHEKARLGLELLEGMLSEFETRAYKFREQGLANAAGAAGAFMEESRRVVDKGIERARDAVDEGIERAMRAAETLEEHIQYAIVRARETGLIVYDELPVPWRVNPHIRKGYRFTETKIECIRSAFGIHNEFFNIWSHALGLVVVLAVALYFYPRNDNFSLSSQTDIFIAAVFFSTACLTLVCSTVWHTMNAVADMNAISLFACVDYTGISLLIAASIMTTEYTAFYCDPVSRWIYMSTTAILGIGGVILPWHPTFNGADMAWARVAFFVGLAATGFAPIIQLYFSHGPNFVLEFYSPIAKSICVYLVGACVYASQVPERWFPGMFDYIGGSHNLWHLAVLGGILFHYTAMQAFFTDAFRRAEGQCSHY
ncbi:HlyIII-domain-containing protein [Sodiomyces alkalinus F11]|uniref:HlyIII-domain-containing protein n=1 Tax=Sodiomyces alkalinus (strain CBS 110278 / VKM F-3762 / F11) TaxID=1314773 RepID=A0A3N2PZ40_SODAK|nr:HlyIII-domain-containing protein [Sodiomyces alkalinus F11]ROT39791.1 HlyIII-domain-containing protein [Sodiomyces alkalinus F11]